MLYVVQIADSSNNLYPVIAFFTVTRGIALGRCVGYNPVHVSPGAKDRGRQNDG